MKYLKQNSTIWCPFDIGGASQYVSVFTEAGHNVIATHIDAGYDFFTTPVQRCDYIISNPPYSRKVDVMERLFEYKIPFALLLPAPSIFDGTRRFEILKDKRFELMVFDKRCDFISGGSVRKSPPHSSLYLCSGILPRQIVFERLDKPGRNQSKV